MPSRARSDTDLFLGGVGGESEEGKWGEIADGGEEEVEISFARAIFQFVVAGKCKNVSENKSDIGLSNVFIAMIDFSLKKNCDFLGNLLVVLKWKY